MVVGWYSTYMCAMPHPIGRHVFFAFIGFTLPFLLSISFGRLGCAKSLSTTEFAKLEEFRNAMALGCTLDETGFKLSRRVTKTY
jgi:hypothetical protein